MRKHDNNIFIWPLRAVYSTKQRHVKLPLARWLDSRCLVFRKRPRMLEHLSFIGEEGGTGSGVPGRGRPLPTEYHGRHSGGRQVGIDLWSQTNSLADWRGIRTSRTRSKTHPARTRWSPHKKSMMSYLLVILPECYKGDNLVTWVNKTYCSNLLLQFAWIDYDGDKLESLCRS